MAVPRSVEIEVPGRAEPLHAICVHLGLFESDRRRQLERLCARIDESVDHAAPLVVGGDFNDWRERASSVLRLRLGMDECFKRLHGEHARSFPSWLPALRLDRVYARALTPLDARALSGAPWSELSDHAALCVDLAIP